MTDIITITQAQTMSSLQIAELTGKRHDAILRDIRNLLEQGVNAHNFVEVEYTDKKGESRPCYQLTKTGCLILASGYNAVLREKIINRWIELEMANAPKLPQTFAEALRLAAEQAEENERLMIENGELRKDNTAKDATIVEQDRTISLMKPKANYYDVILNNPHTLNTTTIASDYGMTANKFNKLLHSLGIQKKGWRRMDSFCKVHRKGLHQNLNRPESKLQAWRYIHLQQVDSAGKIIPLRDSEKEQCFTAN